MPEVIKKEVKPRVKVYVKKRVDQFSLDNECGSFSNAVEKLLDNNDVLNEVKKLSHRCKVDHDYAENNFLIDIQKALGV